MLLGDREIWLEMGLLLLWSKRFFFYLIFLAARDQKWDRILLSKDRFIHNCKT